MDLNLEGASRDFGFPVEKSECFGVVVVYGKFNLHLIKSNGVFKQSIKMINISKRTELVVLKVRDENFTHKVFDVVWSIVWCQFFRFSFSFSLLSSFRC